MAFHIHDAYILYVFFFFFFYAPEHQFTGLFLMFSMFLAFGYIKKMQLAQKAEGT